MSRSASFRCAAEARRRGDQLAGTAAQARGWVLIEHPGPWPFAGFAELDIDTDLQHALRQAALAAGMRILLIRRHGRQSRDGARAWGVLRYDARGDHRQEWGNWTEEADLADVIPAIGRRGRVGLPPVYLVCTHGIHDACCAIRGRPVARALSDAWPEQTWECSHVGGDRYAANVLVAPDGVCFGGVTATSAVTALEQLRAGIVSAEHLRGYAELGPGPQYAVAEVLRRYGPAGRHDIQVLAAVRAGDRWSVTLECRAPLPERVQVELRALALPAAQLTCLAPAETHGLAYETVALTIQREPES